MASSSCWARSWPGLSPPQWAGHPAVGFVAALLIAPLGGWGDRSGCGLADPEARRLRSRGDHRCHHRHPLHHAAIRTDAYGPEARPVEPPFNSRIALPWVEWGENGLACIYPWGFEHDDLQAVRDRRRCGNPCGLLAVPVAHALWPDHAGHPDWTARPRWPSAFPSKGSMPLCSDWAPGSRPLLPS